MNSEFVFHATELTNAQQKILWAARKLCLENGLNGFEFGDLAKAANVGRASLYRHYPGRRELIYALIAVEGRHRLGRHYIENQVAYSGTGLDKFAQFFSQLVEALVLFPEFFQLLSMADANFGPSEDPEDYAKLYGEMFGGLFGGDTPSRFLTEGQADGSVRGDLDADAAYFSALCAVTSSVQVLSVNPAGNKKLFGGHEPARLANELVELLVIGLKSHAPAKAKTTKGN